MATAKFLLANPTLMVNGVATEVVPNSISFTTGDGEQAVKAASAGGTNIAVIIIEDIQNAFSTVKAKVYSTVGSINLVTQWKTIPGALALELTGTDKITGQTITRQFANCALTNDVEVPMTADGEIDLEFKGRPAV